jgi:rubrerythrin
MELKGSATHANLKAAFARKAMTDRLYRFCAKLADNEGRRDLARLFRELADGETMHAHGLMEHLRAAGDPVTDAPMAGWESWLQNAADASRAEAETLFPEMAAKARADGFAEIAEWFDSLSAAEARHAERLTAYRDGLNPD